MKREPVYIEGGKKGLLNQTKTEDCVKEDIEFKEKQNGCEKMKVLRKLIWKHSLGLISWARTTYFDSRPFSM